MIFNAAANTRGDFWSTEDFFANRESSIVGKIRAQQSITFNAHVNVVGDGIGNPPLIGIIDNGFSRNNPDIDYGRIIAGRDWNDNDSDPFFSSSTRPEDDHGTAVLGIIGATQDNGIGINGITNEGPIWIGRAVGSGQWARSLTEFVNKVKELGQNHAVVNLSFDLTQQTITSDANGTQVVTRYELTPEERTALEYARQNNVLIVAAAGNTKSLMSVLGQASREFENIITVGASDGNYRANYSGYGPGLDLLAPGGTETNPLFSTVGSGTGHMFGSSIAAAQVSGTIAELWKLNPELNNQQIINILKLTATDVAETGWDEYTGSGLLNVEKAIELTERATAIPYTAPTPYSVPTTWSGEGNVTLGENPVAVRSTDFTGWIMATAGARVRTGPGTNYPEAGPGKAYQTALRFDGWDYGTRVTDVWLGTPDERWYRISGTNQWISSALVNGNAPGSTPLPQPASDTGNPGGGSIVIGGITVGGNFHPVYIGKNGPNGILGKPISGVITHSSGTSYQVFEGGSIVSSDRGTFPIYGKIREEFLRNNGLNGRLGVPTSGEVSQGNGTLKQTFKNGYIIWNGQKAVVYFTGNSDNSGIVTPTQPRLIDNPTPQNPLTGFSHPLMGAGSVSQGPGGSTSHIGRQQYAIDYAVPIGTPVYAMRSGKVIAVRDVYPDTGGGPSNANNFNYVLVEHDGGYRSAYLHLKQGFNNQTGLTLGSTVNAGQLIGYSGNSGWSTGPHLHVEVQRPGAGGSFGQTVPFAIDTLSAIPETKPELGNSFTGTLGVTKGGEVKNATLKRIDGKNIENKKTWIVIHGWNDDSQGKLGGLANAIDGYEDGDQVLTLDWSNASKTGSYDLLTEHDKFFASLKAASTWITSTAKFAVDAINSWGISASKINVAGHSLGSFVAYEIAKGLKGISSLIALDPATQTAQGYNDQAVKFSDYSDWAWSFYGSLAGSSDRAKTADESFEFQFGGFSPDKHHGAVVTAFTEMLESNNSKTAGNVSKLFSLDKMKSTNGAPWTRHDGFEAWLEPKETGNKWVPNSMDYYTGSSWNGDKTINLWE